MYGSTLRTENENKKSHDLSRKLADNKKLQNVKRNSETVAKLDSTQDNGCRVTEVESKVDQLGDRLDVLQEVVARLETQTSHLMQEISSASCYTKQCVIEAEKSKEEYQNLKERAEQILFQLQRETIHTKSFTNPRQRSGENSNQDSLYSSAWQQTFPKHQKHTYQTTPTLHSITKIQQPITQTKQPITQTQQPSTQTHHPATHTHHAQSILRQTTGSDNSLTRRAKAQETGVKIYQDPGHVSQPSPAQLYSQSRDLTNIRHYNKPQYTEPYKLEQENYKCLRRRSFIYSGNNKQDLENKSIRNSQLVEETNEIEEIL